MSVFIACAAAAVGFTVGLIKPYVDASHAVMRQAQQFPVPSGEFSSSGEYVLSALAAGNVATTLPRSKVIVVNAPAAVTVTLVARNCTFLVVNAANATAVDITAPNTGSIVICCPLANKVYINTGPHCKVSFEGRPADSTVINRSDVNLTKKFFRYVGETILISAALEMLKDRASRGVWQREGRDQVMDQVMDAWYMAPEALRKDVKKHLQAAPAALKDEVVTSIIHYLPLRMRNLCNRP